jgi:adenylate cyclase
MPSDAPIARNSASDVASEDEEVMRQVEQILRSPGFERSKRLGALLKYLVNETLEGRGERIKAFTIAQDIFGRDASFDRKDAIVRVEAGRLRRRLKQYYLEVGQDYSVRIEIPKGSYRPVFTPCESNPTAVDTVREVRSMSGLTRIWKPAVFTGLGILSLILLISITWSLLEREKPTDPAIPFLAVIPFEFVGEESSIAKGIEDAIVMELGRLQDLRILAPASASRISLSTTSLPDLRHDLGISHVVSGNLSANSDELIFTVQLTDTQTGDMEWSDRIRGSRTNLFELENEVVNRVGIAIPVMADSDKSGRLYLPHTDNRQALDLFRVANRMVYPRVNDDRVLAARQLYRRVIELDSEFAGGYAGVASTYFNYAMYRTNELRAEHLSKMLESSQKAVELDFEFGMGHATLGLAYGVADQPGLALSHSRIAVNLQPSDPYLHESLGTILIMLGMPGDAIASLEEALYLNPTAIGTPYLNLIGVAKLHLGKYEEALDAVDRSSKRGGPDSPHARALRATLYAELGRYDEANAEVAMLKNMFPEFPYNNFVEFWFPDSEVTSELFKDFK